MDCKYWDEEAQAWSTEGVTTSLMTGGGGASSAGGSGGSGGVVGTQCATMHLTTFGGVLSIPTSADELLQELKNVSNGSPEQEKPQLTSALTVCRKL